MRIQARRKVEVPMLPANWPERDTAYLHLADTFCWLSQIPEGRVGQILIDDRYRLTLPSAVLAHLGLRVGDHVTTLCTAERLYFVGPWVYEGVVLDALSAVRY
jgi:hypothetical protein